MTADMNQFARLFTVAMLKASHHAPSSELDAAIGEVYDWVHDEFREPSLRHLLEWANGVAEAQGHRGISKHIQKALADYDSDSGPHEPILPTGHAS